MINEMINDKRANEILIVFQEDRKYIKLFREFKEQLQEFNNSYERLDVVITDKSDREMFIECLGTSVKVEYSVSVDKDGRPYGRIRFEHQVGEDKEVVMDVYFDQYGSGSEGFPGADPQFAINHPTSQGQIFFTMLDKLLQTKYFKAAERLYPLE